ncbi:hypothetical protein J1N35_000056 [Gossypium stocksii]|uniref:Uncharacterized protein n=1 Tax=Gossypium stocksii TaxID=47602 RepID=A0A9D3WHP4_9ROSI|nr:hypothetical protein J1N35_000056 [Gossypium stocksii]
MQGGHVWCRKVLQEINKAKAWANTIHTVCHNLDNLWFRVTEFDRPNQSITVVVVAPAGVVVVGVGRMTYLDRIKNAEVFTSPKAEVFESHKVMEIGNEKSSPTAPRTILPTMATYILSIESESSRNKMNRAIHSDLV